VLATNSYGDSLTSTAGNGAIIYTVPDAPTDLQDLPLVTNGNQIGLQWVEGAADGGTPVIDYTVLYDHGGQNGVFVTLASGIVPETYTAIGLVTGTSYTFKVFARNNFGESLHSAELTVLAAQIPDKPEPPTTVVDGANVNVQWVAPFDQGSPITGYKVYIRTVLDTYILDLTYCDGADAAIMAQMYCPIPIADLRAADYNLPWSSSIYAKFIAFNVYGDSLESDVGNGAVIMTYPDKPLLLQEVYAERTSTTLGLQWTEGAANGGSTVLDYTVNYAEGLFGTYVELQSGVLLTEYTAVGLTPGETYSFRV
jgi:hypothetical protein